MQKAIPKIRDTELDSSVQVFDGMKVEMGKAAPVGSQQAEKVTDPVGVVGLAEVSLTSGKHQTGTLTATTPLVPPSEGVEHKP